MSLPNTIGRTEAILADGSVVMYRDADPAHIRQERFQHILDSNPISFEVTGQDGAVFGVDLVTGNFNADGQIFHPVLADCPLRLIYYRHMECSTGGKVEMMYFVVGWQTTIDGKNVKIGMKIFPKQRHWELTEDI